jgi:hypothetical protein
MTDRRFAMRRARFAVARVSLVLLAALALVAAGEPASATDPAPVPVVLESPEGSLDPCGLARVAGLKPVPGNTLSVRAGPGRHYPEIDRLAAGREVLACDHRPGWHGILYDSGGGTDCDFPDDLGPYRGRCRSGWVAEPYLEIIAG